MQDLLIADFTHPLFKAAFRAYFTEMDIPVADWDALLSELTDEGDNLASLRISDDGRPIGFALFAPIELTSWFFRCRAGFLREFWVDPAFRRRGHGSDLLTLAQTHFADQGIPYMLLTSETAGGFFLRRGYVREPALSAKNGDAVFVRRLI